MASALAPRAYDKLKKVLNDGKVEEARVSVLISMMIYDQNERVLHSLEENDNKIDAIQDTVNDLSEQQTKVLAAVRGARRSPR